MTNEGPTWEAHKSENPAEDIDLTGIDTERLDLDVSQEPNPWRAGESKRMDFTRRLARAYAPEKVPREVIARLGVLFAKQEKNYRSGDTKAQRAATAELQTLLIKPERAHTRAEKQDPLAGLVTSERRDNSGLEYVSILPTGTEATPREWREKLRALVGKFTK